MKDSTKGTLTFFVCVALLLLAAWVADDARHEAQSWARYRDAHHCHIVRLEPPPAGIGTTPGKTVWRCDTGELIERQAEGATP